MFRPEVIDELRAQTGYNPRQRVAAAFRFMLAVVEAFLIGQTLSFTALRAIFARRFGVMRPCPFQRRFKQAERIVASVVQAAGLELSGPLAAFADVRIYDGTGQRVPPRGRESLPGCTEGRTGTKWCRHRRKMTPPATSRRRRRGLGIHRSQSRGIRSPLGTSCCALTNHRLTATHFACATLLRPPPRIPQHHAQAAGRAALEGPRGVQSHELRQKPQDVCYGAPWSGSVKQIRLPSPSLLSAQIRPWCPCTMHREM